MEKSSARTRKLWIGLLILLAQFAGALSVQRASASIASTWQYLQSLRFKKEIKEGKEKHFFTKTDCSFSVTIENIPPEKITNVAVNDVPQNSSFISMRKETAFNAGNDQYGTKIILTFRFNEPGAYQIKPVDVKADIYYCRIPIESVYVYENLSTIEPKILITFEDQKHSSASTTKLIEASVGDHIRFTLSIRYATQIVDFAWPKVIPEDSLFTEVERFDITRHSVNTTEFSPDSVPIATFDWQPLKQGSYKFPDTPIVAVSSGGITKKVALPSYRVKVRPKVSKTPVKKKTEIFSYAFSENPEQSKSEASAAPVFVDTDELLELHKKERYSIPFSSEAKKARQEAEKRAGLNPSQGEPNIPLLIIIWALFALVLAGTLVLFLLHKIPAAATSFVSALLILICAVIFSRWALIRTAVFKGGEINSIPEEKNSSGVLVIPGTVIRMERESGDWVYIRYNDTYGWVKKDALLEIR